MANPEKKRTVETLREEIGALVQGIWEGQGRPDQAEARLKDVLAMDPIPGVAFVQGDFHEPEVLERLLAALGDAPADLVMSDMAPNFSGVDAVDQPASMALTELAHELAVEVLESDGSLVTKMFQGEGSDALVRQLRNDFRSVKVRKPEASRDRSREVYVVARGRQL